MTPLDTWRRLPAMTDTLTAWAAEIGRGSPTTAFLARARKAHDADLVHTALRLLEARRKAAGRIDGADTLWADPEGVEIAPADALARHVASRFAALAPPYVLDLCCGIGVDARALRAAGLEVVAVDRDPLRAWMAARNAGGPTAAADIADLRPRGVPFNLDPARRLPGGRRVRRLAEYQPGPDVIAQILSNAPTGALRLGPGVELDALPAGELELVSLEGKLVQCVVWTGDLADAPAGQRRATSLPTGATFVAPPGRRIRMADPGRYLLAVDPAIERIDLTGALCEQLDLPMIHPALGLLTADRVPDSPWLRPFELHARMPWRPKRLRSWLRGHDGGAVELRTRGKAVDAGAVQKSLQGDGGTRYIVFALRMGKKVEAWVTTAAGR